MLRTLKEDGAKSYVFTIKTLLKVGSGLAALFLLTGILAFILTIPAIVYGSTTLLRSCLAHPLARCIPYTLETHLYEAAENGNEEHVQLLLDAGADANYSYMMYRAIENGRASIAEMLLDAGADANYKPYVAKESALCLAIEQKNASLTKKLIQNGADTNVRNKNGWTPLAIAVERGDIHLVQLLLEHGADTNQQIPDKSYPTPLFIAASRDYLFIMQLLINAGADVNIRNSTDGNTPLHIAAMRNNIECIKCLIHANADQHTRNHIGKRAKELSQKKYLFN
jgi:ankyrin repeat protein